MLKTLKINRLTRYGVAFLLTCCASLPWSADSVETLKNPRTPETNTEKANGIHVAAAEQQKAGKEDNDRQSGVANKSFRDCLDCPEMIMLPGGSFMMGSPSGEEGSETDERPSHEVKVESFAIGKYEVTRTQFSAFVDKSGYDAGSSCFVYGEGKAGQGPGRNWRDHAFHQDGDHPVACVSFEDTLAYVRWLSRKTGKNYRLPTEAEWEYAARAGSNTARYWGGESSEACKYANVGDQKASQTFPGWKVHNCSDGYVYTAPVGRFQPNHFGLYDMLGNVWEWTCSAYAEGGYDGNENKCARDEKDTRVNRGGSWSSRPVYVRSANRIRLGPTSRISELGFRLVRD